MNRVLSFKIIAAFFVIIFFSCSKDSDEQTPQETETTVTTANFSKTIDENPTVGQVIGTVDGSTNQGTLAFELIEESPAGALYIDAATGELKVADETLFDFETNPLITGTVKVISGTVSKNASITITLNDLGDIYEGNVILRSQEEVNTFGANNYTQINGSLIIGKLENEGYSDITDLTPLQSIKIINGIFQIKNNAVLKTTEGLTIDFISSLFEVSNNSSLESVKGLNNLTSIFSLSVVANDVLTDLSGLSQVVEIQKGLVVGFCPMITNLDWAINVTSVEILSISNCHSLKNIDGLSNLTNFNYGYPHISISENNSLENLNGLHNLNDTLIFLEISQNPSLKNINGLANTNFIRNIDIVDNELLENLDGLESVTSLGQYLSIRDNNSLSDIEGLTNLGHVMGDIGITRNVNLTSLSGLETLYDIEGIAVIGNTNLNDFCSLLNVLTTDPNTNFQSYDNAYNPTKQDIIDGNCSL